MKIISIDEIKTADEKRAAYFKAHEKWSNDPSDERHAQDIYDQAHGTTEPVIDRFLQDIDEAIEGCDSGDLRIKIGLVSARAMYIERNPQLKHEQLLPPNYSQYWSVCGNNGKWIDCDECDYETDSESIFIKISKERYVKILPSNSIALTVK